MRILLVSQMYPGPADPDLGAFVDRWWTRSATAGTSSTWPCSTAAAAASGASSSCGRRCRRPPRPDVVWAHFLVPSGLIASSVDAPLVVTAHGRDVRNVGTLPGVAALTRRVVRRAQTVIAVSDYLRRELEVKVPERARQDGGRRLAASTSSASRSRAPTGRLGDGAGLPRRRRLDRAQERRPPRRRVRAARPRQPHVRRRRAAARRSSRAASASASSGAFRTTRCRAGSRRGRRRLRAVVCWSRSASRSWRRWPAAAPSSRPGSAARPSSCRPEAGDPRRPARRRRARPRARSSRRAPEPERGRARRGRRRTTSGFRPSGSRRSSSGLSLEVGEPDLDQRADPLLHAVPRARARAPARSSARTFALSTPCLSRLSPVRISFWICSRARASSTPAP